MEVFSLDSPRIEKIEGSAYTSLGREFEEVAVNSPHLIRYVSEISQRRNLNSLKFVKKLSREMGYAKTFNYIYPVTEKIFVHVYKEHEDTHGVYHPIEPLLPPEKRYLLELIEEKLAYLLEEEDLDLSQNQAEALEKMFDKIVKVNGSNPSVNSKKNYFIFVDRITYESLKYEFLREKNGFSVIEAFIRDPYIEDISCDGVGPIFVEHKVFKSLESTVVFKTVKELNEFTAKLCNLAGRDVNPRRPIIDATLPDGSRLNVVYGEDVSRKGSNFTIRKFSKTPLSITQLIKFGTLNPYIAAYLWMALSSGLSIFVCGETASGKTSTLNAMVVFINPTAKIISIEDTAEVYLPHPNWVSEVTKKGEENSSSVELFDLLKAALRQRPNYIIVGEIRGREGHVAFQAMQTGHPVLSTFHAGSMEALLQRLTGEPISIPPPYVNNLNVVIFQNLVFNPKTKRMERRVTSLNEVIGYDPIEKAYNFNEAFVWDPKTDNHIFRAVGSSYILEYKIAPKRGLRQSETRRIYRELEMRAYVLQKMVEYRRFEYQEVWRIISKISEMPYFAEMNFGKEFLDAVEKIVREI
ncbi:MAG: type II/IV secretion system ATPase subunit [Candidatus Baldrarchaeia archaeon]